MVAVVVLVPNSELEGSCALGALGSSSPDWPASGSFASHFRWSRKKQL
jgi:hypothetical protein